MPQLLRSATTIKETQKENNMLKWKSLADFGDIVINSFPIFALLK